MDFGEPAPDVIARLYNEIKEKKVWMIYHFLWSMDLYL
jgi:hypothetical protein